MGMLKTMAQALKIPDIRKKLIFTILMLVIFRIGSNIPVPGMDRAILADVFSGGTGLFALFDLFSGGAFSNFTIFALGITPYITASIILQLLTIAIPALERLSKEGTEGRKKIAQYTRYLTVVLALVQSVGLTVGLFRRALISRGAFDVVVIVLTLSAGTAFLMWLGGADKRARYRKRYIASDFRRHHFQTSVGCSQHLSADENGRCGNRYSNTFPRICACGNYRNH